MAGSSHVLFSSPTDTPVSTRSTKPDLRPDTAPKPRGRKSGSSKQANKLPQRGMGVAQLERIRVQTENNNNKNPATPAMTATPSVPVYHNSQQIVPYQLYDPRATVGFGVPVHLPKFGGFGPVVGPGFIDGAGVGRVWPGVVVATAAAPGRVEGGLRSSELPSIPKMEISHQGFDHNHEVCASLASKKKRVLKGHEEICRENCSEKVEVVAVHRKSNAAGRVGLLMEYGFFPSSKGNSDNVISSSSSSSSSSAHCYPSYPTTTLNIGGGGDIGGGGGGAGFSLFRGDGEGSIDLSLRL